LERLAAEVPNLRVALARAVERGEAATVLRLAEAWQLLCWSSHADSGEALRWLEATLTLDGGAEARVRALVAASGLEALRGNHPRAVTLAEEGLAVSLANDYLIGVAYALYYRGVAAKWGGDLDEAAARFEEAIARWRDLDAPYWVALAQSNLADVVRWQGDIARASALAAVGLAGSRAVGDPWGTAFGLGVLAAVACEQRELPRAAELYGESLATWMSLGDRRGVAGTLAGVAGVAVADGDYPRAARLLGAAAALGDAVHSNMLHDYERVLAATRAGLDKTAFDEAWTAGRALDQADVAAVIGALGEPAAEPVGRGDATGLTRRERDVLRLLAESRTDREIAEALYLSPRTVSWHVSAILAKLGTSSRRDAAARARRDRLI
jgi:non-specific serine/threonine protein kinase